MADNFTLANILAEPSTADINDIRLHGYRPGPLPDWMRYGGIALPNALAGSGPQMETPRWRASNPFGGDEATAARIGDDARRGDWLPAAGGLAAVLLGAAAPRGGRRSRESITADAKSKGFDTDRMLYHGSIAKPFDQYDLRYVGSANDGGFMGEGVYLTPKLDLASNLTLNYRGWRARTNGMSPPLPDDYGHVTENYIRGKIFEIDRANREDTVRRIREVFPEYKSGALLATTAAETKPFADALRRAGYTGVHDPGHATVMFHPDDIYIAGRRSRDGSEIIWP